MENIFPNKILKRLNIEIFSKLNEEYGRDKTSRGNIAVVSDEEATIKREGDDKSVVSAAGAGKAETGEGDKIGEEEAAKSTSAAIQSNMKDKENISLTNQQPNQMFPFMMPMGQIGVKGAQSLPQMPMMPSVPIGGFNPSDPNYFLLWQSKYIRLYLEMMMSMQPGMMGNMATPGMPMIPGMMPVVTSQQQDQPSSKKKKDRSRSSSRRSKDDRKKKSKKKKKDRSRSRSRDRSRDKSRSRDRDRDRDRDRNRDRDRKDRSKKDKDRDRR